MLFSQQCFNLTINTVLCKILYGKLNCFIGKANSILEYDSRLERNDDENEQTLTPTLMANVTLKTAIISKRSLKHRRMIP